jgi:2-iminobutanoate/2-iminopropanoate deaminase
MHLRPLQLLVSLAATLCISTAALGQQAARTLEKKHHNYSEWTKGLFAEAVTVRRFGNATLIYLGGIGAEEEKGKPGDIRAPGDITGQCNYSFEKIAKVLSHNGATLKDIVKMTSYLTSAANIGGYIGCRNQAFKAAGAELPAETLLIITGLAWPNMLLEVDVDAITAK